MPEPSPEYGPAAGTEVLVPGGMQPSVEDAGPTEEPEALAKKRLGVGAWVAIAWLVLIVGAAVLAPVLPLVDPGKPDPILGLDPPPPFTTWSHILGTNRNGNDMLSYVIYGARASLVVGVGATAVGFLIGGFFGLLAGYYRGWVDSVFTSLFDILLSFPSLILALFLVTILKGDPAHPPPLDMPSEVILVIALGLVAIPILARITRASTLTWSQRDFVLASRAQGAKTRRILVREVLPNVLPAMFSLALLSIAIAIVAEGGLGILGVGVQPPTLSWGNIMTVGQDALTVGVPWVVLEPAAAIFLTVYALNYLGDVVRERFDVRESTL